MQYYKPEVLHEMITNGTGDVDNDRVYYNSLSSERCINEYVKWLKQKDELSKQKNYYYLITFTLVDKDNESSAEAYIIRQTERSALKLQSYEYVKEYTKAGMPHWHVSAVTTKPLKKDRFHYYSKKYGSIDLSRSKAQHDFEALNYISKSATPTKLL